MKLNFKAAMKERYSIGCETFVNEKREKEMNIEINFSKKALFSNVFLRFD